MWKIVYRCQNFYTRIFALGDRILESRIIEGRIKGDIKIYGMPRQIFTNIISKLSFFGSTVEPYPLISTSQITPYIFI